MYQKKLGSTGLFVSELCLGTMTFGGGAGMWRQIGALDQTEAGRLVGRALDAGINFIDTADVYAEGLSEQITGQALRDLKVPRDSVVVATKGYGPMGPGANAKGASRLHLIDACKASLKRLQLDHIDLYQVHGFDPATPIEEQVRALDILVQHGHVRYVGVSNWAAWQIVKALGISARAGLARFETLQAYYSIAGRDLEREIVPMLRSEGSASWSGARWPAACSAASMPAARGRAGARASTSRRSTAPGPTPASTPCARWRRPAASRWPRWRSPGCCTARR